MSDDLYSLSADLGQVADEIRENVVSAVRVSSLKTKRSWQSRLTGSQTLPGLVAAVSYDVTERRNEIEGEIGFDKAKAQGPLGNISEFGSVNNPPRGFGAASLAENEPDFVNGIDIATGKTLRDARLG